MNNIQTTIVIGAGPVGLAAAAHLISQGITPIVLEKGQSAGSAMQQWGHVKVFTPWKYLIDKAVLTLLKKTQWQHPKEDDLATGQQIVDEYLIPAAATPELAQAIIYGAEVIAVAKQNLTKSSSSQREEAGYTVHYQSQDGQYHRVQAQAVIDASGTWSSPNPIGLDGLPVPGERENAEFITYGIPDVSQQQKHDYAGKRTLVLGGGHSAINVTQDLLKLQQEHADTKIHWGLRRNNLEKLLGGGINDKLPARGELGLAAKHAIDSGALNLLAPLQVDAIEQTAGGLKVSLQVEGKPQQIEVDRIVVAVGFRPELNILRELRLDIDEVVEAPRALAPLIDPNKHSCGTVRPHGVEELAHHDQNFFIAGMKAYGRAPTFLMLTGYEQVRSIVAELAGDYEAARRVELMLPPTGVCSTKKPASANDDAPTASCCGPVDTPKVEVEPASCCASEPQVAPSCCG